MSFQTYPLCIQLYPNFKLAKILSQTDLANAVGITYAQIGRYETKGAQPSAEV